MPFKFRIPLDILLDSIPHIGDFPFSGTDGVTFDKPTLFVKGAESKYINKKNIPVAEKLFPNMKLETIEGAGHWGECAPIHYVPSFFPILTSMLRPSST